MIICGPKLSLCGLVIGAWAIIQLVLMGVFLRVHAISLLDDLPVDDAEWASRNWNVDYVNSIYDQASNNCFVACGIYVAITIFSFIQYRLNARSNYITH